MGARMQLTERDLSCIALADCQAQTAVSAAAMTGTCRQQRMRISSTSPANAELATQLLADQDGNAIWLPDGCSCRVAGTPLETRGAISARMGARSQVIATNTTPCMLALAVKRFSRGACLCLACCCCCSCAAARHPGTVWLRVPHR